MAKRKRYPARPAARSHSLPVAAKSSGPVQAGGLTDAELARAAELEAEITAREQAAAALNAPRQARARAVPRTAIDASVPLSVRAAGEYAYVARDVRRIALTAAVMFGILFAIWAFVNMGGA